VKKALLRIIRLLSLGYALIVLAVAGCQNSLLYHPRVSAEPVLLQAAAAKGVEPWLDSAGALIGWRIPNPRAKARLLVFHGNAIDAIERAQYLRTFNSLSGGDHWETCVMEYPGYGARPGSPGRSGFYKAGREAINELRSADKRPIFLLGESLGSATACAMAAEQPDAISGLLLVVPFARVADIAKRAMPFIPVGLILRDRYDNMESLKNYHGPVAVVVAENDEVVSAEQGRLLHSHYAGQKLLIEMAHTSHNTFEVEPSTPWVKQADAFLGTGR
jgi:pimeloyl-ACP methyl ester carboxylesterase